MALHHWTGCNNLTKPSIELLRVQSETDQLFKHRPKLKSLEKFIKAAEKTILERVDFVNPDTELAGHMGFIRKFGRRAPEKPRA